MEIIGRNPTPDKYSIEDIRLDAEVFTLDDPKTKKPSKVVNLDLCVSLKPKGYVRRRFREGLSYEAKQNPCELKIEFNELRKMVETLTDELRVCYQVLGENDLLGDVAKAKKESS
jgi:hypothetical protein